MALRHADIALLAIDKDHIEVEGECIEMERQDHEKEREI